MASINKGSLFPAQVEKDIFSYVTGHSSLAKLSAQEPLPFVGKDIFLFNFANDVSIVGESAQKPVGDGGVETVAMQPVKVVYGMRVSNEFMYAAEEYQMSIMQAFADGFAKKLGSALDKMAILGVNPADGSASSIIGDNCFDKKVENTVVYDAASADTNIDAAVALVEANEYACNGAVISPTMRGALAALTADGARKYPEFAFGGCPNTLGAMSLDSNAALGTDVYALVGDFADCFRWGIAKELPLDVIEYGDPDGNGDLKRYNQVYLRSEAFIGWAIMNPYAFAFVVKNDTAD